MKEITIDCQGFVPRSDLHKAFADSLAFPDYYGNNLNALHDCLTDIAEETRIILLHWGCVEQTMENYAHSARRTIEDAAAENPHLAVTFA